MLHRLPVSLHVSQPHKQTELSLCLFWVTEIGVVRLHLSWIWRCQWVIRSQSFKRTASLQNVANRLCRDAASYLEEYGPHHDRATKLFISSVSGITHIDKPRYCPISGLDTSSNFRNRTEILETGRICVLTWKALEGRAVLVYAISNLPLPILRYT